MNPSPALTQVFDWREGLGKPFYAISLLILADISALLLSVGVSLCLKLLIEGRLDLTAYVRLWPFLFVFVGVYALVGLYSGISLSPPEELRRATLTSAFVFLAGAAATVSLRGAEKHFTWNLIVAITLSVIFMPILRECARRYHPRSSGGDTRRLCSAQVQQDARWWRLLRQNRG